MAAKSTGPSTTTPDIRYLLPRIHLGKGDRAGQGLLGHGNAGQRNRKARTERHGQKGTDRSRDRKARTERHGQKSTDRSRDRKARTESETDRHGQKQGLKGTDRSTDRKARTERRGLKGTDRKARAASSAGTEHQRPSYCKAIDGWTIAPHTYID
jgi:hypothetical protein